MSIVDEVLNELPFAKPPFAHEQAPIDPSKVTSAADIQKLLSEGYSENQISSALSSAQKAKQAATPSAAADALAKKFGLSTPAASQPAGEQSTKQMEQQLASANVWNTLGQGLVNAQENLEKPVEQAVSGGLTAPAVSSAEHTALASIGLNPSSGAGQWLNSQIQQANANDDPLQKAMAAYGAAYGKGQEGIDSALGQMGQANQLQVATAPEADWAQSLAQHILSNVNYYGQIPQTAAQSIPPALQYFLQQSGAGGGNLAGNVPLQNLKPAGAATLAPPTVKGSTTGLPTTLPNTAGAIPSLNQSNAAGTG